MSGHLYVHFAEWLKQHRREAGISQDELAERMSCSASALRKIEAGERLPSRQMALLLAELFHLPPDEREAFVTFARTGAGGHPQPSLNIENTSQTQQEAQAPWRAAHLRQSNMPLALTSFIGREQDEEAVRDLLAQRAVRLLTLVGAPGIGKTRLSMEVAARADIAQLFEDRVYLVELAAINDPGSVMPAIASALGLTETGGQMRSLELAVLEYVQDKRMLLVLDNFEQILDAAPGVVGLLVHCPWLKVMVTSREPLHVRGERRYHVPPLALPAPAGILDWKVLSGNPAVTLFVQRAQEVLPDFELTQDNVEDVAVLCVGLDGLPLAIELAAARSNIYSAKQLHEVLGSRLKLLTMGARDLPARHMTLRDAIGWSYDLLGEDEQRLFRRLGVFVGGFTREAVEAVCNTEGDISIDLLEGLASLADKNLLVEDRSSATSRFRMLETIREYALEQLEVQQESQVLSRAHARYFLGLAQEADEQIHGPRQLKWLDKLEIEHDNLRAAMHWLLEQQEAEAACQLSGSLWYFWWLRDHLSEGLNWLRRSLALSENLTHTSTRAYTLSRAGAHAISVGDITEAREWLEQSVAIYKEVGNTNNLGFALNCLGLVLSMLGNPVGHSMIEESVALCRHGEDRFMLAWSLDGQARLLWYAGELAESAAICEESLDICREIGETFGTASMLLNLGFIRHEQGKYTQSIASLQESLAIFSSMKMKYGIATCIDGLGASTGTLGQFERAACLLGAGDALHRAIAAPIPPVYRASYERSVASVRAQDDPEQWAAAYAAGGALTMEQAIEYALKGDTAGR